MHGFLKNTNTLDDFKACDKKLLLEERSKKVFLQNTNIVIKYTFSFTYFLLVWLQVICLVNLAVLYV